MKATSQAYQLAIAACVMAITVAMPLRATAEVSDEAFKALQDAVNKLAGKVQQLEQTHASDVQAHQQDLEQIQQLQKKLGETQTMAVNAEQKADAAAQVQPVHAVPKDSNSANHNFMILGDAEFQYAKTTGQHGTFLMADFAPIFLYRAGDNILFEAGFDFGLQNNAPAGGGGYSTSINLSFAQLDYLVNDYLTFVTGNMLLPLGTYSERTAGWLNKFPDDPMGRDLLPGTGVGAQLRGAIPVGDHGQVFSYSVFGVNGPGSLDGTGAAGALDIGGNVGLTSASDPHPNANVNLHGNPSGGGRLGWFIPYKPHFDLELGISGQSGEWDNAGSHLWNAGVLDATMHLGPFFEARGEYIRTWYGSDDLGNIRQSAWWVQAGLKMATLNLDLPLINNLELVNRYDTLDDGMGARTRRYSVGYIYYITNTLLFEGDYEFVHGNDLGGHGNQILFQVSYGF